MNSTPTAATPKGTFERIRDEKFATEVSPDRTTRGLRVVFVTLLKYSPQQS